jgi:glycerol transport system ATP-binding protein
MTVSENLAFPLRNRGVDKETIKTRVAQVMEMLDLEQWQNKRARGLSADLKQKISLGRGMVREDVRAILFDEPLTVIDPHMKWQLRSQLKRLHKQFGHTMVYVTHDQTEALTFADKVAVMLDGEILQFGTPEDLFKKPRHTFVGYFIGSPGMNILPITIDGSNARLGESAIALPASIKANGSKTELGIRPEYISLTRSSDGLPVTINKIEDIGRQKIVRANLYGHTLAIVIGEDDEVPADAKVSFAADGINIYADDLRVEPGEAQ